MKGITPVIAVILLMLITISMVGFAFVWFSRIAITAQNATEAQLQNVLNQQAQIIRIDSLGGGSVVVRNVGTQAIPGTQIQVYVNGVIRSGACPGTTLAPGATISCSATCSSGSRIRVTSPGNLDESIC